MKLTHTLLTLLNITTGLVVRAVIVPISDVQEVLSQKSELQLNSDERIYQEELTSDDFKAFGLALNQFYDVDELNRLDLIFS